MHPPNPNATPTHSLGFVMQVFQMVMGWWFFLLAARFTISAACSNAPPSGPKIMPMHLYKWVDTACKQPSHRPVHPIDQALVHHGPTWVCVLLWSQNDDPRLAEGHPAVIGGHTKTMIFQPTLACSKMASPHCWGPSPGSNRAPLLLLPHTPRRSCLATTHPRQTGCRFPHGKCFVSFRIWYCFAFRVTPHGVPIPCKCPFVAFCGHSHFIRHLGSNPFLTQPHQCCTRYSAG